MNPSDLIYVEKELHMSREELLLIIVDYRKRGAEEAAYRIENQNALTAMAKDYQALKAKLETTVLENARLKEDLTRIAEQNQLKTKDIFGRSTEKLPDIINAALDIENEDEAMIEIAELPTESHRESSLFAGSKKSKKRGVKRVWSRSKKSIPNWYTLLRTKYTTTHSKNKPDAQR